MLNLKSLSIQFDDVFFKTLDDDDDVDDNGGVYGYRCVGHGWGVCFGPFSDALRHLPERN